jgi:hypothetical protein
VKLSSLVTTGTALFSAMCHIVVFPSRLASIQKRGLRMLSPFWKFVLVALILTSIPLTVIAEQPARSQLPGTKPPGTPDPRHPPPLTQSSGYIFAGTVRSVERVAPKRNGVATVRIAFRVDEAMQGVRTGQTLTIYEWAGLWEAGETYRPGERVLLFLYPPSKLGLTSPVRGPQGRFKIGPGGRVAIDPRRIDSLSVRRGERDRLRGATTISPRDLVRFLRSAEEE